MTSCATACGARPMLFVEAIMREDRSILDFLDAPFTFVNGRLARHYGIPGVDGEEFRRVSLDGDAARRVLTQGSVLTVSSYPTRTSPVLRGKWVLENLLGAPPPPPPPDVPKLEESAVGKSASLREQLEQHRADPACAVATTASIRSASGSRTTTRSAPGGRMDGNVPIDASGMLPDGRTFHGPGGAEEILKSQSDAFTREPGGEDADLCPGTRAGDVRPAGGRADSRDAGRRRTTGSRR